MKYRILFFVILALILIVMASFSQVSASPQAQDGQITPEVPVVVVDVTEKPIPLAVKNKMFKLTADVPFTWNYRGSGDPVGTIYAGTVYQFRYGIGGYSAVTIKGAPRLVFLLNSQLKAEPYTGVK